MSGEFDEYVDDYVDQHSKSIRLSGESPDFFAEYKIKELRKMADNWGFSDPAVLDFGSGIPVDDDSLAIDGITSFSVRPLRLITISGFVIAAASFLFIAYALVAWFAGRTLPGWASTTLPIYFLGGAHLIALGVIGEYIGNNYTETKARPRHFIKQALHAVAGNTPTLGASEAAAP